MCGVVSRPDLNRFLEVPDRFLALSLLGRELIGSRTALLAAVLFTLSPLVWYYSTVALTYAVEALFELVVVWLCWRACR